MGLRNALSEIFVQTDDPNPAGATAARKPATATVAAKPAAKPLRVFSPFIAVFATLCAGRESQLADKGELAELRGAQSRWEELNAQLERVGNHSAREEIKALRDAYTRDPSAENFRRMREAEMNKEPLHGVPHAPGPIYGAVQNLHRELSERRDEAALPGMATTPRSRLAGVLTF